jgi:3-dehydroquinate dehydratase-2
MANLLILNGPNLNLLGSREPQVYGAFTLDEIRRRCESVGNELGHAISFDQSNAESELVDRIQAAFHQGIDFLVFNPAAYTHTSIALRDALLGVGMPFIEVHISNVFAREAFRHHSYLSDIAIGVISGLGPQGYELAVRAAHRYLSNRS